MHFAVFHILFITIPSCIATTPPYLLPIPFVPTDNILTQTSQESLTLISTTLGSNMVLQRAPHEAVVWGFATQDTEIKTSFDGKSYGSIADENGIWRQKLPPTPASSKEYIITITSSTGESVVMENVLFGDVFICGGQSNMMFAMPAVTNASSEIKLADNYPLIRIFTVGQGSSSYIPFMNLQTIEQKWQVANSTSISNNQPFGYFSAVCWFFGRGVFDSLDGKIPIGLINNNWGGTKVELWSTISAFTECSAKGRLSPEGQNYLNQKQNGGLYNAMINPYTTGPMAITGIIWYQGESNVAEQPAADNYGCLFTAMIKAWRLKLMAPDAYFGFVDIATFCWLTDAIPQMRVAQMEALTLPKVGYSTNADHGAGCDVHPPPKQYCSERLVTSAMALQYNKDVMWRSPSYNSSVASFSTVNGTTISIVTLTLNDVSPGGLIADVYPFNYLGPRSGVPGAVLDCTDLDTKTPGTCAWAAIQLNDGSWINATISVSSDRQKLIFTASQRSNPFVTVEPPLASSYGWGPIPLMSVYDKTTGLPLLGWKENISSTAPGHYELVVSDPPNG